jgi:sugar phosphate isomerase/epimerase
MESNKISRRNFLGCASAMAAAMALLRARLATAASGSIRHMRLGAPIFIKSDDPGELAREHRRLGYRASYTPPCNVNDRDRIKAIIKEYATQDVVIAETGAWENMQDLDPVKRKANLAYVQERLALADELGARCCVDTSGSHSLTSTNGPAPDNISPAFIEATVENCRKLIDAVKPTRTKLTIEMMSYTFPTGPDDYLRLIKAVDRKEFAVHMDICNVIGSPEQMYHNTRVIHESFQKLGSRIISCHAKDLVWEDYPQICLRETIPGRGSMDYKAYLSEIAKLPGDVTLMLEHCDKPEDYDEGRHYVQKVAREIGIDYGADGA